ncbi:hypothetical protein ABBQ38_007386 [Trebouxia sp. C0009 RCD-2024]
MRVVQAICNSNRTAFLQYAAQHSVSPDCYLGGLCRHVYRSHILGLAGSFDQRQLTDLKRCLPVDGVDYVEEDVKVFKTEGPRPQHVQGRPELRSNANRARALLRSDKPSTARKQAGKKPAAEEQDGSEAGPTTDPVLIKVQQAFMAASSHMQQAGLSPSFFAPPQDTLSTITSGVLGSSLPDDNNVQAANGPPAGSQGTSEETL